MLNNPDDVIGAIEFLTFVLFFSITSGFFKFLLGRHFGFSFRETRLKIMLSTIFEMLIAFVLCLWSAHLPDFLDSLSLTILVPGIAVLNIGLNFLFGFLLYKKLYMPLWHRYQYVLISAALLPVQLYGILLFMNIF